MPIDEHPCFPRHFSSSAKLWRYMDFLKFFSLVETSMLYFPSAEVLAADDPFEGSVTAMTKRYKVIAEVGDRDFTVGVDKPDRVRVVDLLSPEGQEYASFSEQVAQAQKQVRRCTYVNSWHMNDHENTAMWKLYAQREYGIAIVSSLERIEQSFRETKEEIYIGQVSYIDYEHDYIPDGNLFSPFMYKIRSLSYENEVRVVISNLKFVGQDNNEVPPRGVAVQCDLTQLIEDVVVSPNSPGWVYDLVNKYVKEKLQKPVLQSKLMSEPHFG